MTAMGGKGEVTVDSAREPFSTELIRLGPIEVIDMYTTPPPADQRVSEALDTRTASYEEIKHLIAPRPLHRADAPSA